MRRWLRESPAMTRYGIEWSDGGHTGGITDRRDRAVAYLKESGFAGRVYTVGSREDPELKSHETEAANAKPE